MNGHFTKQQKEIYELVLDVQKELIRLCNDFPSLDALFHTMTQMLGKRLQEIGLISKSLSGSSLAKVRVQLLIFYHLNFAFYPISITSLFLSLLISRKLIFYPYEFTIK